jgi:hypothetical protein
MSTVGVLDAKVINNEDEHDWLPFMSPKTGGGGTLVVPMHFQVLGEQVIG